MENEQIYKSYNTGQGSPISHVHVFDAGELDTDELSDKTSDIPIPDGCVRLYRGIGGPYVQTGKGSGYFSNNIDIAHSCARGRDEPCLVVVDAPKSVLEDLIAYRRLHAIAGNTPMGFSKGGFSVIQIPCDWIDEYEVEEAILNDMTRLNADLQNLYMQHKAADKHVLGWGRARQATERKIGMEYFQLHGKPIPYEDEKSIYKQNRDYEAAQSMLDAISDTRDRVDREVIASKPTLRDIVPKFSPPKLKPYVPITKHSSPAF